VGTLFRRFDINRDGAVSYQELRDGLRSMKVALSDNETRALFNRLDADHDGTVTHQELLEAISAASGSRGAGVGGYTANANTQMNSVLTRIS
jgi:Ca2+-binding EF-hand superfamily protein